MRGRVLEDESGVSAIIVTLALLALMGVLMLTVDAGSIWVSRRAVASVTDAVALSEAQEAALAEVPGGCSGGAAALAAGTDPEASVTECTVTPGAAGTGTVRVKAQKSEAPRFRGAFGLGAQTLQSTSVAQWGRPSWARGLRPLALCMNNPHVATWLAGLPASAEVFTPPEVGIDPAPGVHRIFYDDSPAGCGWSFVSFEGSPAGDAAVPERLEKGNREKVGGASCNPDTAGVHCRAARNWDPVTAGPALEILRTSGSPFGVLGWTVSGQAGGRATYLPAGFIGAVLHGYDLGALGIPYLDLEFVPMVLEGACCSLAGVPDTKVRAVRLCSVDSAPEPESVLCPALPSGGGGGGGDD